MKEFDMSGVKRFGPLRHSQLEPEIEYIYRRIWAVVAPFQAYPTWEQFEAVCCKNVNPESDIPYFAYVCARFEQYRKDNPTAEAFKLQRAYNEFGRDFFKANPYIDVVKTDGTVERQIMKGFRPPKEQMVEEADAIVRNWLQSLANDAPED